MRSKHNSRSARSKERVICWHLAAVAADPFVHPPVRVLQRKPQLIDQPRNERQLLGRADRATNAEVVGGGCRQASMYSSASAR